MVGGHVVGGHVVGGHVVGGWMGTNGVAWRYAAIVSKRPTYANTGDVGPMKQLSQGFGATYVFSVAFSPDGTRVVAGDDKGRVTLWDVSGAKPLAIHGQLLGHRRLGRRSVRGTDSGYVCVWKADSGAFGAFC